MGFRESIIINRLFKLFCVKSIKTSSFYLIAEALTGLIYHRPAGEIQFHHSATSSPWPLVILLEMDHDSRSDPGGHRKVLPFDWLTEQQKIFVNYYDYAALIRSQLQRTLNCLKNREFTTRTGTARNNTVQ